MMRRSSLVQLALLALFWGSSYLLVKLALGGLTPLQVVFGRVTIGALVLAGVVAWRRDRLPRGARLWMHLGVMALLGNVLPFWLLGFAETRIPSGLAGVYNATTPLFTLGLGILMLREERLTVRRSGGFLLGFGGVVLLAAPWRDVTGATLQGQLAALATAFFYALGFAYTRRFIVGRGVGPLPLAASQMGAATLLLWLTVPFLPGPPPALTPVVAGSLLALGALATGVGYVLVFRLIEEAGATSSSLVAYLIPVVAVVLGVVVLYEPLTWNLPAGAATVLAGVAVAESAGPTRSSGGPGAPGPVGPGRRR